MSDIKPNWEYIDVTISRLQVPGGWIYKLHGSTNECVVYIPDPEIWKNKEVPTAFGGYKISS